MAVIVTRHSALVDYLREQLPHLADAPVIAHATPEHVTGRHVYGVLPLSLAALAERVTEIPLTVPAELRGQELNLSQVRSLAGEPRTYIVRIES